MTSVVYVRKGSRKCLAGCLCGRHTPRTQETRDKISRNHKATGHRPPRTDPPKGFWNGRPAKRRWVDELGYVLLSMTEHPLSDKSQMVAEHRLVLWNKLECESLDCIHLCHWCEDPLIWEDGILGINADHLNEIRDDNRPENLVVSCLACNLHRGKPGWTKYH